MFSRKAIHELRRGNAPVVYSGREGLTPKPSPNEPYEMTLSVALIAQENETLRAYYDARKDVMGKAEAAFKVNTIIKESAACASSTGCQVTKGRGKFVPSKVVKETDERLFKRRRRMIDIEVEKPREPVARASKFVFSGRDKLKVPGFGPGFNGKA